jgi:seryl-tRNA synthetase
MFMFTTPSKSNEYFEYLVKIQKKLYDLLEIPYRILEMPTEELGKYFNFL